MFLRMGSSGTGRHGIPGVIAMARSEYIRRICELTQSGVTTPDADAVILAEARAAFGVVAEGERINLSLWSERLSVPRPVLEALVLSILHASKEGPPTPAHRAAPAVAIPAQAHGRAHAPVTPPITPPPRATRRPRLPDGPLSS